MVENIYAFISLVCFLLVLSCIGLFLWTEKINSALSRRLRAFEKDANARLSELELCNKKPSTKIYGIAMQPRVGLGNAECSNLAKFAEKVGLNGGERLMRYYASHFASSELFYHGRLAGGVGKYVARTLASLSVEREEHIYLRW